MNGVVVCELDAAAVARRRDEFAAFEREFVYPLGNDRFRIDHGADYLAFFRRLGRPHVFAATDGAGLCGVLVLVERDLAGHRSTYVCDWKVTRRQDHGAVARALLRAAAAAYLPPEAAVFGVSMDAAGGSNRLARIATRCATAGPVRTTALALFSCDLARWRTVAPHLEAALGPIGLHSSHGDKDLVLESTRQPLPLLHVRRGTAALAPRDGAVHMFCLPASDPLCAQLLRIGVRPGATATVLHRHLDHIDWRVLSTADI
jgi:hypothetical protein